MSAGVARSKPVAGPRRWLALGMLTGANLLVFASVTIMNVALPDARADLALSVSASQGLVTSYSLAFGALILLGGRVADVVGLRTCLAAGLAGFAAASLLGGLAPDATVLIAARALQGATGAFVAATAVSLISVAFPSGRGRQIAFAALGVVMGIGTAGSFLVGGVLVDAASWRWCLLVNAPLALLVAVGVVRTAPPGPRPERARIDVGGAALVSVALGALVLGLDRAAPWGWRHPATLGLLIAGTVGVGVFAVTLPGREQPLVPLRILGDRARVAAYVAAGLAGVGMFAGMFVLTAFLQDVRGLTPVLTGLAFLPFGAGAVATTWALPSLRRRLPAALVLTLGLLLTAAAVGSFVTLQPDSGYLTGVLPAMVLLGAGGTVVMVTAGDVATAGAGEDSGVAGSMVNSAQQVGAALGTALLSSAMTATARAELSRGAGPLDAAVSGYARAGLIGALLLLVAAAGVALLRPSANARRAGPRSPNRLD